jgi:hypothetical protein
MDAALRALLDDLHVRGTAHDEAEPDRVRRLRNLEPATAELLTLVVRTADGGFVAETVAVGKGLYLAWKRTS